jgi:nucleoside-diphosphate-sugar epimerase
MNLVLTGTAGKLGGYVCRQLVAEGHQIRATDRVDRADLPVALEMRDLLQPANCYSLLAGAETLVHLANHPHFREGEAHRIYNENVAMNFNLFEAAHAVGVKKIVFTSSVQVMAGGLPPYLPFDSDTPAQPGNPYALSKHVSETMLAYYARVAGIDCIALRFPWLVTDEQLAHIRAGTSWAAHNAKEGFSFLHWQDAAALIAAVTKVIRPGFRVYFPAAPQHRLPQGIPDVINEYYAGIPLRRPVDEIESLVDTSVITRETGWSAVHSRL